jgi:hypothetical protein
MAGILLQPYAGEPPTDDMIRRAYDLGGDEYLYLTATMALERRRERIAPPVQQADGGAHLVFHKALRLLAGRPLLTRTEERVALLRAAQEIARDDPVLGAQLRHDVTSWLGALSELAERGVHLESGVPEDLADRVVHPRVCELLLALQSACRRQHEDFGRETFEDAARAFLDGEFRPPRKVVMEGFTYLTPLQHYFAARCAEQGVDVAFVYPFRRAQAYGFAIMSRTYAGFIPRSGRATFNTPLAGEGGTALQDLQSRLFSDESAASTMPDDGTVFLEAYGHRHAEVAACVHRIREYLDDSCEPSGIAVVTRDASFHSILQEEADRQGLPVWLSIPPRMLLLTPVGRFVLTLYEVWDGGALSLDAEALEALLTSGWLGAVAQESAERFNALKAQLFARCRTQEDWAAAFAQARRLRDALSNGGDSRIPAGGLPEQAVAAWERVVAQVELLCRRLFAAPEQSIGDHIRWLQEALDQLAPEDLFRHEFEVVVRIREALKAVAESSSVPVTAAEFGDVLLGLAQEYERAAEEDAAADPPDRIWVTTPEGIDNCPREVVFYLGVDDRRVPRAATPPWPLDAFDLEAYAERERYLFLAVVRAARRHLHLTFARHEQGQEYRPSPYLRECAQLLGRGDIPPATGPVPSASPAPPGEPPLVAARRRTYDLAEVAHFALCPYRYKLERLDPRARQYRDPFQVRFLAGAVWLQLAVTHLRRTGRTSAGGTGNRFATLEWALEAARESVRGYFPGLREADWATVEAYVRREFRNQAEYKNNYPLEAVPGAEGRYMVTEDDRVTEVRAPVREALKNGLYAEPYLGAFLRAEWLIPGRPHTGPAVTEADGVPVFAELYDAVQWWQKAVKAAYYHETTREQDTDFARRAADAYNVTRDEVRAWVQRLEAGRYPKHPGEHCQYCPVRGECLGLGP